MFCRHRPEGRLDAKEEGHHHRGNDREQELTTHSSLRSDRAASERGVTSRWNEQSRSPENALRAVGDGRLRWARIDCLKDVIVPGEMALQ
jgi:hypothetical protein